MCKAGNTTTDSWQLLLKWTSCLCCYSEWDFKKKTCLFGCNVEYRSIELHIDDDQKKHLFLFILFFIYSFLLYIKTSVVLHDMRAQVLPKHVLLKTSLIHVKHLVILTNRSFCPPLCRLPHCCQVLLTPTETNFGATFSNFNCS